MAAAHVADVQKLVTEIRRFRSDQGLNPGQKVSTRLTGTGFGTSAQSGTSNRLRMSATMSAIDIPP